MKSKLTAFLALLLAMIMLIGCVAPVEKQNKDDEDNEDPGIPVKVEPTVEPTPQNMEMVLLSDLIKEYGSEEKAVDELYSGKAGYWVHIGDKDDYRIPVYKYDDILFLDYAEKIASENTSELSDAWSDFTVRMCVDHSFLRGGITGFAETMRPWPLSMLTTYLQGGALRTNPKNTDNPYIMYDTDNGYRIYFFFTKDGQQEGEWLRAGTAAIMFKNVSFEDYKPLLNEGADVDTLIEADPAMKAWSDHLYGPQFAWLIRGGKEASDALDIIREMTGQRLTSAVILTDGMLFITWDYVDGKFVVDTYEYREDFVYDAYGIQVCYKINEEDYVD